MENKVREAMGYLEPALVQEAALPVVHKRKKLPPMLIAACLAALCAVSVAARVYTGWTVGEVTRFDLENHLEEREWLDEDAIERLREYDGEYRVIPQVEHETYPLEESVRELFELYSGDQKVYYDSVAEMEERLKLDVLESPLLKQEEGDRPWVFGAHRDGLPDKLYLMSSRNSVVDGHEEIYCAASFSVYTFDGVDTGFIVGIKENNYTFSQLEIKKLQTTAEIIEFEEDGIHCIAACFNKDGIVYRYTFSCKGELNMNVIIAVLETLE